MGTFFKVQRFALQILKSQRCGRACASALRFTAAALRCSAKKHERCSGTKVHCKNRLRKLEDLFFLLFKQEKTATFWLFSCRCSARHSNPALQRAAVGLKMSALQRIPKSRASALRCSACPSLNMNFLMESSLEPISHNHEASIQKLRTVF
jgi:hypothetical protein